MSLKIVECPRDAMQGFHHIIPTSEKISYIQQLVNTGFDVLDCGSFVSDKAIPQMADTEQVLAALDLGGSNTSLLVIVANTRGARDAVVQEKVSYLGFPFSVSEEFQHRNTRQSITEAFTTISEIQELCTRYDKKLVGYISMGFGNPYGEPWHADIVIRWVEKLVQEGIRTISLSDTVGVAKDEDIHTLFTALLKAFPSVEFGAHFHTRPEAWRHKLEAAYAAGCRRFDGAIKGFGGCPMANDTLTGNMPTEKLLAFAAEKHETTTVIPGAFETAMLMAGRVFNS